MEWLERKCCLQKKWPNRDQLWRVECRLPIRDGSHSRLSIPIFLAEAPKLRLSVAAPGQNNVKFLAASLFTDILRRSLKIITLPTMNPWWIIHYQVCLGAFPNSSKFYLCLQAVTTKLEMTRTTIENSARVISIKSVFSELLSDKCTTIDFRSCMNPNQFLFW